MNDLLLRRRIAIINSTPSLPYDAEVEYLESTGTQYINLGIKAQSTDVVTLKMKYISNGPTTSTNNRGIFGSRNSQNGGKFTILKTSSAIKAAIGSSSNINIITSNFNNVYTIVLNAINGTATVNGGNPISVGTFTSNNYNMLLFTMANASTRFDIPDMQVMELTISDRMHLIPVRVGQVGYMYDTVSGELFGNDGTGDFILGNDIT